MKFFKSIFIVLMICFSNIVIYSSKIDIVTNNENEITIVDFSKDAGDMIDFMVHKIPEFRPDTFFLHIIAPHKYNEKCKYKRGHHFADDNCNFDSNFNIDDNNYQNCTGQSYQDFFEILRNTKNMMLVSTYFRDSIQDIISRKSIYLILRILNFDKDRTYA